MATFTFPLQFGDEVCLVSKIEKTSFSGVHQDVLASVRYADGKLLFADERWKAAYLGAGEEKAVYAICDHEQHVFALEVINEHTYLNGRLIDGEYFFDMRISGLTNVQPNPDAIFRYVFTGLVKVREFVYGYTWDRFQFDARRKSGLDGLMTAILQGFFQTDMSHYRARYKDVHDRNVMFEIRPPNGRGWPILYRDGLGNVRRGKVGVRAIDVR
ncbi:MAG: hypothetical protein K8I30_07925 [Anaerolineae bacterium]|nr:hypothetical protein [Anaerolineae bacterium]